MYTLDSVGNSFGISSLSTSAEIVPGTLVYPTSVLANTPFTISYTVRNLTTGILNMYGFITDQATHTQNYGAWTQQVAAGADYPVTYSSPGITASVDWEVDVGHSDVVLVTCYRCVNGQIGSTTFPDGTVCGQGSASGYPYSSAPSSCPLPPTPEIPWVWIAVGVSARKCVQSSLGLFGAGLPVKPQTYGTF